MNLNMTALMHKADILLRNESNEVDIYILAVPGHALLWLSLVKWKRKKRESARF
jgi:hypothetical protein